VISAVDWLASSGASLGQVRALAAEVEAAKRAVLLR
jgi:hypothetical protein